VTAFAPAAPGLESVLISATRRLFARQLTTGEIATHRRVGESTRVYARSPYMSAVAADALAALDPRSPRMQWRAFRDLSPAARHEMEQAATIIRARLRAFLVWQEEPIGTSCFYGRSSALGPDAATTATVATVLAESARPLRARSVGPSPARWLARASALGRFRAPGGPYWTFVDPAGAGFAWIAPDGRPLAGFDRVVNAHVLRYLAAIGVGDPALDAYLLQEVEDGDFASGTRDYPDPIFFCWVVARAWSERPSSECERIATALIPWLASRQEADGRFGGALTTACAVLALTDLGYQGEIVDAAAEWLVGVATSGEWPFQPLLAGGHGSTAFTSCLAVGALAAWAGTHGVPR
jgi:hypothetical protein